MSDSMSWHHLHPLSAALALFLAVRGVRKGSLAPSGAIAASIVGYLSLANDLRIFGICLLAFFFAGSKATKVKADVKAQLEDGHDTQGGAEGRRDWVQVLANSWLGAACSLIFRYLYGGAPSGSCSLHATLLGTQPVASPTLILTGVAFFAACMGDTLASELGILATTKPRLITTLREVPPGTNGGVTSWGTFCSAAGGLFIGVVAHITLLINEPPCGFQPVLVVAGLLGGFLGSLVDSLLGATLQETRYSKERKKVLTDESKQEAAQVISGSPVLSNNGVNFVSSTAVALALGYLLSPSPPLYSSA